MLRVLKSEFIGYLAQGFGPVKYSLPRKSHNFQLDVFLCRFSCFFLYQISEIIWR